MRIFPLAVFGLAIVLPGCQRSSPISEGLMDQAEIEQRASASLIGSNFSNPSGDEGLDLGLNCESGPLREEEGLVIIAIGCSAFDRRHPASPPLGLIPSSISWSFHDLAFPEVTTRYLNEFDRSRFQFALEISAIDRRKLRDALRYGRISLKIAQIQPGGGKAFSSLSVLADAERDHSSDDVLVFRVRDRTLPNDVLRTAPVIELATVNRSYTGPDACYIACYSEGGRKLQGQLRVKGHYEASRLLCQSATTDSGRADPSLLCARYFPLCHEERCTIDPATGRWL